MEVSATPGNSTGATGETGLRAFALTACRRVATFGLRWIGSNLSTDTVGLPTNMTRLTDILWRRVSWFGVWLAALASFGCTVRDEAPVGTVGAAWHSPRIEKTTAGESPSPAPQPVHVAEGLGGVAIATVNGRVIPLGRLRYLLMRSRGLEVLEQLIGLETAAAAAEEAGVTITQADVDREHQRSLRRLVDPLSSITSGAIDLDRAETLLDTVLAQRGVSRDEFRLVMRRNAYLRKIVELDLSFTADELRREFDRLYGKRAEVRHIQLTSLGGVDRVKAALAEGKDFAELARRFSANEAGASRGGLLKPFATEDPSVPAVFREVAFSLMPGEVSDPVRLGEWYHLIRLERILPREDIDFELLRGELERTLRDRRADQAMVEVFEKLFREASIEIGDPVLGAAFDRKRAAERR